MNRSLPPRDRGNRTADPRRPSGSAGPLPGAGGLECGGETASEQASWRAGAQAGVFQLDFFGVLQTVVRCLGILPIRHEVSDRATQRAVVEHALGGSDEPLQAFGIIDAR